MERKSSNFALRRERADRTIQQPSHMVLIPKSTDMRATRMYPELHGASSVSFSKVSSELTRGPLVVVELSLVVDEENGASLTWVVWTFALRPELTAVSIADVSNVALVATTEVIVSSKDTAVVAVTVLPVAFEICDATIVSFFNTVWISFAFETISGWLEPTVIDAAQFVVVRRLPSSDCFDCSRSLRLCTNVTASTGTPARVAIACFTCSIWPAVTPVNAIVTFTTTALTVTLTLELSVLVALATCPV